MSGNTSEPELFLSSKDEKTGRLRFVGYNPETLKILEDFPVHPDDIFVCGFPKSGNVWTLTIIMAILNQNETPSIKTDFKKPGLTIERFPHTAKEYPHPGVFVSHLPYDILPKRVRELKVKVFNILRNPKDVVVSYFHFHKITKRFLPYALPWGEFFEEFINGRTLHGDYFQHVKAFWRVQNEPNIFKLEYEDLKKDPRYWIAEMAKFLGKPLCEENLEQIVGITNFENMKQNPNMIPINHAAFVGGKGASFLRKGQVGDWRSMFTKEQEIRMDGAYQKMCEEIGRPIPGSHC